MNEYPLRYLLFILLYSSSSSSSFFKFFVLDSTWKLAFFFSDYRFLGLFVFVFFSIIYLCTHLVFLDCFRCTGILSTCCPSLHVHIPSCFIIIFFFCLFYHLHCCHSIAATYKSSTLCCFMPCTSLSCYYLPSSCYFCMLLCCFLLISRCGSLCSLNVLMLN